MLTLTAASETNPFFLHICKETSIIPVVDNQWKKRLYKHSNPTKAFNNSGLNLGSNGMYSDSFVPPSAKFSSIYIEQQKQ
jgi:hypothetical protein